MEKNNKVVRITESEVRSLVKQCVRNIMSEGWNGDRFNYENFSEEGNGGIEEYATNIAQLIAGLGGDPDSIHALGEEIAQLLDKNIVQMLIEGLESVMQAGPHLTSPSPQEYYDKKGIVRN